MLAFKAAASLPLLELELLLPAVEGPGVRAAAAAAASAASDSVVSQPRCSQQCDRLRLVRESLQEQHAQARQGQSKKEGC
jgi:hypothetical protein